MFILVVVLAVEIVGYRDVAERSVGVDGYQSWFPFKQVRTQDLFGGKVDKVALAETILKIPACVIS